MVLRTKQLWQVLLIAVGLAASGCGDKPATIDGPLLISGVTDSGMDAQFFGEIMIEGDCLKAGSATTGIAWPGGTTWDSGEGAVVLSDGRRLQSGDSTTAGGGEASAGSESNLDPVLKTAATECGFEIVFMLSGDSSTIEIDEP